MMKSRMVVRSLGSRMGKTGSKDIEDTHMAEYMSPKVSLILLSGSSSTHSNRAGRVMS